jgi:two-component system sensor histidine kinase/response regulator
MMRAPLARILIVDDESELRSALCRILESQGYATSGVASGLEALNFLRAAAGDETAKFDILVTDLMMPFMDGIALMREARAIDADLVSIVMTGHGTIDTAVEAMKAGALDYLLKPFNLGVAIPVLSRALTVRRLRLQNGALMRQVAERTAELEESNRLLQTANKELDAYNSSVSHDIRGHLNRIIGFSRLLSDDRIGPLNPKQLEFIAHICDGGEQILRLTDDLLRFARLGQQQLLKERVTIRPLIHQIFDDLRQAATGEPVQLQVGALPDAFADPPLLKQVFVNLLSNAIKFSGLVSKPFVTVDGLLKAGECVYSVADNGAGFDMAHADQLFKMFHRLQGAAKYPGTGIGLSIVQRIVERHGGVISAQSAPGAGAKFTFTLPAQG